MKILYLADFGSQYYGSPEYKTDGMILDGLIKNGHQVETISYREVRRLEGNAGLLKIIDRKAAEYRPDVMIIGYGDGLDSDFIDSIRRRYGFKLIYWYGDARPKIENFVLELASVSDLFFMTTGGDVLKDSLALSECDRVAFFPNLVNPDLYEMLEKVDGSMVFTGSNYGEPERAAVVSRFKAEFGDKFVTPGWDMPRVKGYEYAYLLGTTEVGLAINAYHDRFKYQSDRTLQYASCGVLLVIRESPGLDKLFDNEDLCIFKFNDTDSAVRAARDALYYAKDRDNGRKLSKYTQDMYNNVKIAGYMLDELFEESDDSVGPWREVYRR